MKSFPIYIQHDVMDCGPTCLRMIAAFYGKHYSLEGLREKSFITREGVSLLGISEAAEHIGFRSMAVQMEYEKLEEAQLQQNIIEIQMERTRESNTLKSTLKSTLNDLEVSIENWEMAYLLISPASGTLSCNDIWQKNQNVNSGDKVFSIVAAHTGNVIGKIKLPINGSGKVKQRQRVNISVTGYPYMEYGYLTGEVLSVSLLTNKENMYSVTVKLPQDLHTSYGKQLNFKGELAGTAEVVTDERSVTARLLSPLRYLWEKFF